MNILIRPWRLYADSAGRSTIAEYWLFMLVKCGVLIVLLWLGDALSGD